jgi:site-specific DNA recombinase
VPVPALVSEALFAAVQEQLAENRRRRRQSPPGVRYLLQGLLVCAQCGYAFYGKTVVARGAGGAGGAPRREHAYYRCSGTDRARFGGTRLCENVQLRTDRVEAAVWQEARALLEQPERVAQEYRRRLETATRPGSAAAVADATDQAGRLRQGLARLIDGYTDGLLEKAEFEPRLARLRERIARLEAEARRQADEARLQRELTLVIGRVEAFAQRVAAGLAEADWQQRREILQALVKRVEVDRGQATVVFRIDPRPPPGASRPNRWQDPGGLVLAPHLQPAGGPPGRPGGERLPRQSNPSRLPPSATRSSRARRWRSRIRPIRSTACACRWLRSPTSPSSGAPVWSGCGPGSPASSRWRPRTWAAASRHRPPAASLRPACAGCWRW